MTKKAKTRNPRILIVTPEITYLPEGMGNLAGKMSAKAGGMADVSASLVQALHELGADVHVALPHYRRMFHVETAQLVAEELRKYKSHLPNERIHLAKSAASITAIPCMRKARRTLSFRWRFSVKSLITSFRAFSLT